MQLAEADRSATAGMEEVAKRQLQWRNRSGKPLALAIVVLVWQAVGLLNQAMPFYNPLLFPAPWDLLVAGWKLAQSGVLWWDIVASTSRVLIGTLAAAPIGIVLGIAVARIRWLEVGIEPIIELLRPVPTLALLPMIILWFGIGETSKILFIAYSCFFVIFTTTLVGVRNVDPILLHAGESLGFGRLQLYRFIILRAVLPDIMLGVRLGLSVGFLVIVAAEFIAADTGLGYLINYSRTWFRVADMLVGAIVIGLLGVTANYALVALERRMFRWRTAGN
ncbi:NitT/TauT family transport system permease protein/taurine transport system permease protein/sulfonate transport system permease protein [Rhizobiales bacterium GAS191]|nr:NitT/TauT family transport system permease protein/taurine transport system permease protein/sulfonate transport system permease protein [Rhizobiales bacterium GAS191]